MTERAERELLPGVTSVVAVGHRSGRFEGYEFIQSLDLRFRVRYQRYIERLASGHQLKSPENMRRINNTQPPVHELKVDKYRVYVVRAQGRWFITHGRDKPKDNQVNHEVDKALTIFWESEASS